jgi:hypothetical protein
MKYLIINQVHVAGKCYEGLILAENYAVLKEPKKLLM